MKRLVGTAYTDSKVYRFERWPFVREKQLCLPVSRSDEGPMLETIDFTIRIDSTPTFLYFNLNTEHCSILNRFK